MPIVRELPPSETPLAFEVMRELRSHLESAESFTTRVNELQRPEGYRLVASFEDGEDAPLGVGGFRVSHNLAWGRFLYVDDLVTAETSRSQGHGAALLGWLTDEAERLECDQFHLDSGTQRTGAHRFYLRHRLDITAFHFANQLPTAE
jgi:GNAT superfamily N-acetyltransferase